MCIWLKAVSSLQNGGGSGGAKTCGGMGAGCCLQRLAGYRVGNVSFKSSATFSSILGAAAVGVQP